MMRGTTPKLTFNIPLDVSSIKSCYVTLEQQTVPKTVIEKGKDELILKDTSIAMPLTQEETLSLNAYYGVKIQLRILTTDDKALASDIFEISCDDILKEGVIS